jgi:hypothetical protein
MGYKEVDKEGTIRWFNDNGNLHREGGHAIEYINGGKEWWLNGVRHREDSPAFEHPNGYKEWWINGELHRENGPAIEIYSGNKKWYLNSIEYTHQEYKEKMRSIKMKQIL